MLVLDLYDGNDPDGMFRLYCRQVTRELASKLAVIFRHLVRGGSFSAFWRLVVVIPMPKRSVSSDVVDCRPISITPVLSKALEKIVAGKLSHFLERNSMLPPFQFSYHIGTWEHVILAYIVSPSTGCFG